MQLRPLHDYVIIRRKEDEHISTGGIVIPDTAAEKPAQGEVIAVGNGRSLDSGKCLPMTVRLGDQVLFSQYAGTEVNVGEEEVLVMHEKDIIAVLE